MECVSSVDAGALRRQKDEEESSEEMRTGNGAWGYSAV
jgi:hypothetical protein